MIAAAISATGVPDSAASAASWLAASVAEQPSRSMSAPLAMSMTERAAALERARSSSCRWRSMTAARRRMSSPLFGTAHRPFFCHDRRRA